MTELGIVVLDGEGGQLNAVRVELGLSGKEDKSSTSRAERSPGLSDMVETGRGNAS
jgi:hypothetical protein